MRIDKKTVLRLGVPSLTVACTIVGVTVAPCAAAEPADSLRAAIAAARSAAPCGPLRSDPTIDQVADKINESTDDWLNHTSRAVPETDALPALKDSGVNASKAMILSGNTPDVGNAVKAIILQGFAKIPDCSYSSFGVATTYNAGKHLNLLTAVLAG